MLPKDRQEVPPSRDSSDQQSDQQVLRRGTSSSNRLGSPVGDFATLIRPGDQSPKRSDTASSDPEIVHVGPSIESEVIKIFTKMNEFAKRDYELFKEAHDEHLIKSKEEILKTARVALERAPQGKRKKALILGIGNSLDIPLQKLVKMFDEVTVVEFDGNTARKVIEQLPPELWEKVTLVVADVTGIAVEYCKKMQKVLDNSKSITEFTETALDITDKIAEKVPGAPPDVGNDYAFVCSQLLSSQLLSIPLFYVDRAVEKKFGSQGSYADYQQGSYADYQQGWGCKKLSSNLQQAHILDLARSVAPSGTVHFADTYKAIYYSSPGPDPLANPGQEGSDESSSATLPQDIKRIRILIDPREIETVLHKIFKPIKEQASWTYNLSPGRQDFEVKSHSLEVRPSEPKQSGTETPLGVQQLLKELEGTLKDGAALDEVKRILEEAKKEMDLKNKYIRALQDNALGYKLTAEHWEAKNWQLREYNGQLQETVRNLEQSSEKTEEALIKLEDASKRTLKAVAESGKNTMDSLKQIEAIRNKLGDDQNLVGVIVLKGEDYTPKPKSEQE